MQLLDRFLVSLSRVAGGEGGGQSVYRLDEWGFGEGGLVLEIKE